MVVHAAHAAAAGVTFRGTYQGTSSLPAGGAGQMTETIVATGKASALGISRLRSSATGPINPAGCFPMSGRGRLASQGKGALAYRFQLSLCFPGAFGRQRQPPQRGSFTITSGTGDFKGARGTGTYVEAFQNGQNAPPGPVTIRFRGTLLLPSARTKRQE